MIDWIRPKENKRMGRKNKIIGRTNKLLDKKSNRKNS